MTTVVPEATDATDSSGLSRRRILQGVAWATPAIVVATAVPAAAGSPETTVTARNLGIMAFTGSQASQNATAVAVHAQLVYGGAPADHPVTDVIVKFSIPTTRVNPAGAVTFTGASWSYIGSQPVGTDTVFTFSWTGTDLSGTDTITTALDANLPKLASVAPLDVGFRGESKSNTIALAAITDTKTATVAGALTASGSASLDASLLTITTALAYSGGTAAQGYQPITGLVQKISVPSGRHSGGNASTTSANWTAVPGYVVDGANRVFSFTWGGTALGPAFASTTPLVAVIPKTSDVTALTVQASAVGASNGANVTVGPSPIVAAGTLPAGVGVDFTNLTAAYSSQYWSNPSSKAVNIGLNYQNLDNSAPATATLTLTIVVPGVQVAQPRWGVNGASGVPSGWTLVGSGPTVSNHVATLVLTRTQTLTPWGNDVISNLWIETGADPRPANVTATISATYASNAATTRSRSASIS